MRNYASFQGYLRSDLAEYGCDERSFHSGMSYVEANALSLAHSFYKKLLPDTASVVQADTKALEKFKAINASLPIGKFEFRAENDSESYFWDFFREAFRKAIDEDIFVSEESHVFDLSYVREHMNIGPGSAQKADSRTFAHKLFTGQMSYTDDFLIPIYRSALESTGLWAEAEMLRYQSFGFTKVDGGKVFFAPKNAEISRTCCTEGNLNMLIQKAVGQFLEERLKMHFGVSLSTQPANNKELARIGSIDGSFGTIDLVSASDSISVSLLSELLREGSFLKTLLMKSRSEWAILPDGSKVKLNMVSTMGNGFTFPLQTLIFASAVRACYQLMDYPCVDPRTHFGVFGDDIVVRKEIFHFLCRMLNKLGFSVNVGKSFNSGPFRESCGGDYFMGQNVRGVYIQSLETPQQVASAINRLFRWTARSGIRLPTLMDSLCRLSRDLKIPVVPFSESDDAGVKVPFQLTRPKVTSNYWFSYRKLVKRVVKLRLPEPDESVNPPGFALSFLAGHTRRPDCTILVGSEFCKSVPTVSIRDRPGAASRHKVRKASIPYWDWEGYGDGGDPVNYTRWKAGVMASYPIG